MSRESGVKFETEYDDDGDEMFEESSERLDLIGNGEPEYYSDAPEPVAKGKGKVPKMEKGDLDHYKVPKQPPRRKPKRLNCCFHLVGKLLLALHFFHLVAACIFLYLIVNWVENSYTVYPDFCIIEQPRNYSDPNPYAYDKTYSGGLAGVVLKPEALLQNLGPDHRKECKKFSEWYYVAATQWKGGIGGYTAINAALAILSALYTRWLFQKIRELQPKDSKELLKSMFIGFPKGSFMISYAWGDEAKQFAKPMGELPRTVGRMFPNSWMDIENLIPGTPVKETCGEAARNSIFRFAFISDAYLKSPNCLVEWSEIKPQPGHSIIFYYPDTPKAEVKELQKMGHWTVPVTLELREELLDPTWFVTYFLRTRRANPLFGLHSPGINESWRPTLRYWIGDFGLEFLKLSAPSLLVGLSLITADIMFVVEYNFMLIFTGFEVVGILFAICLGIPLFLILLSVYIFVYLWGTGLKIRDMPDVAYCLMMLYRLDMIDTVRIYSNQDAVTKKSDFQALVKADVVEVVDDIEKADVKILLLDNIPDNEYKKSELDESFVFWSKKGFVALSNYAKDTFGTYLIGDAVPGVEFLGCKMLMSSFRVEAKNLTAGTHSFKTLMKRTEPPKSAPARCLHRCLSICKKH